MDDLVTKHIFGGKALAKGSKPFPLEHKFVDQLLQPIDLSVGVWTGQGRAEQLHVEAQPSDIGSGTVTVDPVPATATYVWADEDFATPGRFRLIIYIGNGTNRHGSTVYEWDVSDAPGADPTV